MKNSDLVSWWVHGFVYGGKDLGHFLLLQHRSGAFDGIGRGKRGAAAIACAAQKGGLGDDVRGGDGVSAGKKEAVD